MITDSYGNRRFYGIYRGVVQDNADPLGQGRVRLKIPQVLFNTITDWAWASNTHGVRVPAPMIGQGVWVQFEGGDPSFPVWVGTFGPDTGNIAMAFDDLTDVTITSPTNRQVPVYNSITGQWENTSVAIPAGGGLGNILVKNSTNNYDVSWSSVVPGVVTVDHVQVYVKNDTGSTLHKGQAVYISGSDGTNPTISLAKADAEPTSSKTLGLLMQDLDNSSNKWGYVMSEGLLSGLDTSSANAGDVVWLSPTTAGGLVYGLANKPYAPNHMVFIGYVTKKSAGSGEIYIKPQNGFELDELHNVDIGHTNTLTGKDILQYDSGTSLWKNTSLGSNSLYVGTTQIALNRASAAQALTGITSIDGSAATLTTSRTLWGQSFNGSANVTGDLNSVGNITGSGAVALVSGGTNTNLTLDSGTTGSVKLGTSAYAKEITIGNSTTGTTLKLTAPSNGLSIPAFTTAGILRNDATTGLVYSSAPTLWGASFVGTNVTADITAAPSSITGSGAVTLASASGTNLTLNATGTSTVFLDSTGAGTVTIGANSTTLNVGSSGAKVVKVGNTTGATATTVSSGSGGLTLDKGAGALTLTGYTAGFLSSSSSGVITSAVVPISQNYVLNGAFDIWQRGTSGTPTSLATRFVADRWETYRSNYAAGLNVSRQSPSITGFQYSMRLLRATGNTSTATITAAQPFETVNSIPLAGQTVTLSFYARRGSGYSATSNLLNAQLIQGTGTDQNNPTGLTGATAPINVNITLTTGYQFFSYTGTVDAATTQLSVNFNSAPVGTAVANDFFEITGVQLELGSVATPFRRAGGDIQGELAACQRYYYRKNAEVGYGTFGLGWAASTTVSYVYVQFPVVTRKAPSTTLEWSGTAADYNMTTPSATVALSAAPALDGNRLTTSGAFIATTVASGLTLGQPSLFFANNAPGAYLGFSAEL